MSTSLYDLAAEFAALEQAACDADGEATPELDAAFAALGELEASKVDAYRHVVRMLDGQRTDLLAEIDLLHTKKRRAETGIARLKDRLTEYMRQRGLIQLRGHIFRADLQRNGGQAPLTVLVPATALPADYQIVSVCPNTGLLRGLADADGAVRINGEHVAQLEPLGEHLRFR